MKNIATKNIASFLLAAAVAAPTAAVYAQSATEISGTSGGNQPSADCGFIPAQPDYSFNITQSAASVSIEVSGTNDYTLLMVGPDDSRECILAHDFDGGKIQSRGLYKTGAYRLYVGDVDGSGTPFTMTVQR